MAFESEDKCLLYDTVQSALSNKFLYHLTPSDVRDGATIIQMIQFVHATAKLDVSSIDDLFHDLTFQAQGLLAV